MALHKVTFRIRALTSLVFVAVMLLGLLGNVWSFFLLFSIVHFGCWYEYQKMLALVYPEYAEVSSFQRYGVMIAGWCVMMFCIRSWDAYGLQTLHYAGKFGGLLFLFILPVAEVLFVRKFRIRFVLYAAFGLLYISLSMGLLMNLRTFYPLEHNDTWFGGMNLFNKLMPLQIIVSLWINDTMAYLTGSIIGRTPLSSISPRKTWEGTIGGLIFAIAAMGGVGYFLNPDAQGQNVGRWMMIAAIAAITGTIGDLLESKLKRMAGVKDSGSIMPGHGGFLDRFDSLVFATPFVWLYIVIFAN